MAAAATRGVGEAGAAAGKAKRLGAPGGTCGGQAGGSGRRDKTVDQTHGGGGEGREEIIKKRRRKKKAVERAADEGEEMGRKRRN